MFLYLIYIFQSFKHPPYGRLYVVNDEQVLVIKTCSNVIFISQMKEKIPPFSSDIKCKYNHSTYLIYKKRFACQTPVNT